MSIRGTSRVRFHGRANGPKAAPLERVQPGDPQATDEGVWVV